MNKLLKDCFVKQEKFKPKSLGGETEITIRELTIAEAQEYQEMISGDEHTQQDAIFYAVKCSMVEPVFFTDEELEQLNATGRNLIYEIHGELPLIGKSTKEREAYFKRLEEYAKKLAEKSESETEEDEEEKK